MRGREAVVPVEPALITCVLFDLYGTLVDVRLDEDTPELWAELGATVKQLGGAPVRPADLRGKFRSILRQEGERSEEGFLMEAAFARLLQSLGAREDVAHIGRVFRQYSIKELAVRPYVAPLFDALRRAGCSFGIVSNTEAVLTRYDLEQCPIILSADAIVLSSEVGVAKPHPRIFETALARLRAAPASTVFVGNSMREDIVGALGARLRALYLDQDEPFVARLPDWAGSVLRARPTYDAIAGALGTLGSAALRAAFDQQRQRYSA